jgi:adhesin transport system membrane fusion protein
MSLPEPLVAGWRCVSKWLALLMAPAPVSAIDPGIMTQSRAARYMIRVLAGVIAVFFVWSALVKLDEVVTGQGKVVASGANQVIQSLEGGIIENLYVREGQQVEVGDPIVRIDDTQFQASFREQEQARASLEAQVIRLKSLMQTVLVSPAADTWENQVQIIDQVPDFSGIPNPAIAREEYGAWRAALQAVHSDLAIVEQQVQEAERSVERLERQIPHTRLESRLASEERAMNEPLVARGSIAPSVLNNLRQKEAAIKARLAEQEGQLAESREFLEEAGLKYRNIAVQFRNEQQLRLSEVHSKLAQLEENRVGLKDKVDRTVLRSPIRGIVKAVYSKSLGGVAQAGVPLVEIVPADDQLIIETRVNPQDIGFIHKGQNARVQFSAYDFVVYGGLEGKVTHVSADTVTDEDGQPFYLIHVETGKSYLGEAGAGLDIMPGMTSSVNIMTGKRSLLAYLAKPILRARQTALREP